MICRSFRYGSLINDNDSQHPTTFIAESALFHPACHLRSLLSEKTTFSPSFHSTQTAGISGASFRNISIIETFSLHIFFRSLNFCPQSSDEFSTVFPLPTSQVPLRTMQRGHYPKDSTSRIDIADSTVCEPHFRNRIQPLFIAALRKEEVYPSNMTLQS